MDTKKKQLATPTNSADRFPWHECLYEVGTKRFIVDIDVNANKPLT